MKFRFRFFWLANHPRGNDQCALCAELIVLENELAKKRSTYGR